MAGWTLADHQKYWQAKRGSVGRANPGAQLRVVDDDGNPLGRRPAWSARGQAGSAGPSADWMRTTDMARIDEDGFLWILGRADQAIIRGGFKVMPDDVRAALESHPAVLGAAVVGPARRTPRRNTRCGGGVTRGRIHRCRRTARLPAKPAGALRDPHRDRDRRCDPEDAVRQARSERHPWPVKSSTVAEILRLQASSRGAHALLVCDADRLSYAEADRRSAELARGLIALGAGKGTHVGVLYPNGAEFVVAMLAAARIGAVVVPFSTFATDSGDGRPNSPTVDVAILLAAASYRGHDYRQAAGRRRRRCRPATSARADRIGTGRHRRRGAARGDGRRRRRIRPAGDHLHVGFDRRAQGRGAHPRRRCSHIRRTSTRSAD